MSGNRITLTFMLDDLEIDEEAGTARYRMTPEAVERWMVHLQAASAGLEPIRRLEVRGQG